jgi:hypothetical protein
MQDVEAGHGPGEHDIRTMETAWFRVDDVGWLDDEYVVILQAFGESGWQRGDPASRPNYRLFLPSCSYY